MQKVIFKDLGNMNYRSAWDYQESLLQENVQIKSELRLLASKPLPAINANDNNVTSPLNASSRHQSTVIGLSPTHSGEGGDKKLPAINKQLSTVNYLLLVEHPPVYTLGKSGHMENILISESEMEKKQIEFYRTNRGGDITFHGPGQIVGYPILDLEKFYTDIGRYLRCLEQVIILTMQEYGLNGARSSGETGVWLDVGKKGSERKICAMGVRCSRWITMHGFAFNINTDLEYFNHIIPCGIQDKEVTSLQKELGSIIDMEEVKVKLRKNFEIVFQVSLQ